MTRIQLSWSKESFDLADEALVLLDGTVASTQVESEVVASPANFSFAGKSCSFGSSWSVNG